MGRRLIVPPDRHLAVRLSSVIIFLGVSFLIMLQLQPNCFVIASSLLSFVNINKSRSLNGKNYLRSLAKSTKNHLFSKIPSLMGCKSRRLSTIEVRIGVESSSILDVIPRGGGDSGETEVAENKAKGKRSKKTTRKSSSSSSGSGSSSDKKTKSKSKKAKKTARETTATKTSSSSSDSTKKEIDKAMKQNKVAAQAMGDAIR